jgi:hypothetical protein
MRALAQKQNRSPAPIPDRSDISVSGKIQPNHTVPLSLHGAVRLEYDLGRVPLHPPAAGAIQTKLSINKPGDEYEREADRVADQVMRMPDPPPMAAPAMPAAVPDVQRKCSCGGSCDHCASEQDRDQERLQMKRAGPGELKQTTALPIVHHALRSPGQPLDRATRAWFEPRFGHDFSRVRVHTGAESAAAARSLGARAFTVGPNLVFAAGEYAAESARGRSLLAHELAHVVQQSRLAGRTADLPVQRSCLPDSECAMPATGARAGSAKEFSEKEAQREAPLQAEKRSQAPAVAQARGHGRRAAETEKLFQKYLPRLWPMVQGVFVDETLRPEKVRAARVDCLNWAKAALPAAADKTEFEHATRGCVVIPKDLETLAAQYNQKLSAPMSDLQRHAFKTEVEWFFVDPLTHEVTHERFEKAKISFGSSPTCTPTALAKELTELAACISEFPVVQGLASDVPTGQFPSVIQFASDRRGDWEKAYLTDPRLLTDPGESIFGSIREIRCSCECGEGDSLIRQAFDIASKFWSEDQRAEFHIYMKQGKGKEFGVYWPFEISPRVGKVGRHELTLTPGVGFTGSRKTAVAMLTYHYVLSQWASGRLRWTAGAQVNPAALLNPALSLSPPGEFGGAVTGLRLISTPESVETKFGGFSARVDTGLGVGEFLLKPETTGVRGDFILEVAAGVQFFIPGLRSMTPVSLEAAYRLAKPLDSDARSISTFGLSLSLPLR